MRRFIWMFVCLHVFVTAKGVLADVQIRTLLQDSTTVAETEGRQRVESEQDHSFNKTIAAQFNTLLEKEFEEDATASRGTAPGAGRSFSNTVRSEGGTLETVVRVHRQRGNEFVREVGADAVGASDSKGSRPIISSNSLPRVGGVEQPINDGETKTQKDGTLLNQLAEVKRDLDRALATGKESTDDVDRLVDSADNEFVMSNPKRGTMELQQDLRLINDLVIMLCSAAVSGAVFGLLNQPLITGYIVAGSLVGPGGLGMIVELVQVETFAQFGIIFLLFGLGLEFNISKLQQVRDVAVYGGVLQMVLSMLVCGVISDFAGASAKEGVFVGAFLSVSSTAVVAKCLIEQDNLRTVPGQITMGTLILQDCTIGLLFALIPVLGSSRGLSATLTSFSGVLLKMVAFTVICVILSELVTKRIFRFVVTHSNESYQLTAVAFCLTVACATEHIGLSMELGAFVAGVALSTTPYAEKTLHDLEPFRNIFTALFLTSIGLIMNPHFLWLHLDVLLLSVLLLILFKTTLIAVVVRAFGYNMQVSLTVGVSLAQVGELSFVLLSRASAVDLVERKLYLLLLGTTALSLVLTPTLFRSTPHVLRLTTAIRLTNKEESVDETTCKLDSFSKIPHTYMDKQGKYSGV
ncbi:MAG: hypothetical protein CMB57_05345 [Euryarchaeota archaeon]|nr:hypothetical protein [Euryarchaeota archaeon]